MKSLLFAPALVSFVNTDQTVESTSFDAITPPLVAIATVTDPPIVELANPPEFVPVVAEEGEDERVQELQQDLEKLAADLTATQRTVETVAQQRDQAREEVSALAKANHEMLKEMKAFRQEMEEARADAEQWKARAVEFEQQVNDRVAAAREMQNFRVEMKSVMDEFRAMKGDLAVAREELQDPIERANLKEQLAEANAKKERLSDEIEMALIAREKTILEAARTRKQLEGKIANLVAEVESAREMRDELRSVNAEKMKALADVEVLKKQIAGAQEAQAVTAEDLKVAQEGLVALQAEKAAAVEAGMVARQERDEARTNVEELRGQVEEVRAESEASKVALAQMSSQLKDAQVVNEELAEASGALDKAREEVVFLNKAKGGLEELLFKKTAEIRKLKGELRKVQASREKASGPPETPKAEDPTDEAKGEEGEASRATALAD